PSGEPPCADTEASACPFRSDRRLVHFTCSKVLCIEALNGRESPLDPICYGRRATHWNACPATASAAPTRADALPGQDHAGRGRPEALPTHPRRVSTRGPSPILEDGRVCLQVRTCAVHHGHPGDLRPELPPTEP